jgi:hypothetical protein
MTLLRDWTTAVSFTWTPTAPHTKYRIIVWARSAGEIANTSAVFATLPFRISPPPPTLTSLTADKTAPQLVNTSITFTANLSGGLAPYQTKWWLHDGTTMTLLRDWTTAVSFTWTPTAPHTKYRIIVWARSAGEIANTSAVFAVLPFAIAP